MTLRVLLSTLLAAAAAAIPAGAADARLHVEAGLGGLARPGRWAPVRVAIENGGDALDGELVVEWGDARVRRKVALAPGSRRQFELYVRTPNVRDAIAVRLEADGRAVQTLESPVRIVRFDEDLVVCVGSADLAPGGASCATTIALETAPTSWRGYDAADDVVARSGGPSLSPDHQRAVNLWRALRTLDESGGISRPRDADVSRNLRPELRLGMLAYLLAIPAVFAVARRTSPHARQVVFASGLLVLVATSAALAVGRVGPGSAVVVNYSGTLHQFPGLSRSWLLMRGSAQFPTAADFALRAPFGDGAFDTFGARDDQRYEEDGSPVLAGHHALAARKAFAFEGAGEFAIVETTARPSSTRVANLSSHTLDDCRVKAGGVDRPLGALSPGASLEVAGAAAGESLALVCDVPAAALPFTTAGRSVQADGRVQLVVHLAESTRSR